MEKEGQGHVILAHCVSSRTHFVVCNFRYVSTEEKKRNFNNSLTYAIL